MSLTARITKIACSVVLLGMLFMTTVLLQAPRGAHADGLLTWDVPQMTAPTVIAIGQTNRDLNLALDRDYVLDMPHVALTGLNGLRVNGGRNVVLIGGAITVADVPAGSSFDARRGLVLKNQTGTVHIEGLQISGNALAEGIQIAAPQAIVQLQNIRVNHVSFENTSMNSNVIKVWGGVRELRVDRLTGSSASQGMFFKSDVANVQVGSVDLRRVNISGGTGYLFYADATVGAVRTSDVFAVPGPTKQWLYSMSPALPAAPWNTVVSGTPAGGDFVPTGSVGPDYVNAAWNGGQAPETTTPPTTVPATTVPATTLPPTTVPATTLPATTVPATMPPATVPATVPPTTVPPTTVPATTVPAAVAAAAQLTWNVPALSSPTVIEVGQNNRVLSLALDKDYVLKMPDVALTGLNGLRVTGGRNVVLIGGAISIGDVPAGTPADARRGLVLKNQTGIVHIEGVQISGNGLAEGIQIAAPQAIVQLQKIRINRVSFDNSTYNSNVIKVWGGVRELRVDRLTGISASQGMFFKSEVANAKIGSVDLRKVNISGGSGYVFYKDATVGTLRTSDVFATSGPTKQWLYSMYPALPSAPWNTIVNGAPAGGDFVPSGSVGPDYVNPSWAEPQPPVVAPPDMSTPLTWGVPALSSPTVIPITQTNRDLNLALDKDFILKMPDVALSGLNGLRVTGGRNVVLIGGTISITDVPASTPGDPRRGVVLKNQTGTVHIEGLHISGNGLSEGIQIAAPLAVVQLQNIRIDRVSSANPAFHSDVVQVWGGVRELRVDRLTGSSAFQGIFLKSDVAGAPIGSVDLRRVNLTGGSGYLFYADPAVGSVRLTDVYAVTSAVKEWQYSMFPAIPADPWGAAIEGTLAAGDFVAAGSVGRGYTNPSWVSPVGPTVVRAWSAQAQEPRRADEVRSMQIRVDLDKPAGAKIYAPYTLQAGTATAGSDFDPVMSGLVVFDPGQTTKTVWIKLRYDGINENTETFRLILGDVTNAVVGNRTATATILDGQ